jgi:hypothetical protein
LKLLTTVAMDFGRISVDTSRIDDCYAPTSPLGAGCFAATFLSILSA